jgi:foldase protein PrsA
VKRAAPILVTAVVVTALVVGVVLLATGSGASAFTVNGQSVSQSTIDDELAVLHDNTDISSAISGAQVAPTTAGSISVGVSNAWVNLRILSSVAEQAVHRRGGHVTAADRKSSGVESSAGFKALPHDFGQELIRRVATVRALQRLVGADTASVSAALSTSCPSGRYVSHILVADLATAQSLKQQLDGGADFATLAAASSTDTSSAQHGGSVGCVGPGSFVEAAFQEVATTQAIGVVSDPVKTKFGYHLILVSDKPSSSDISAATLSVLLQIVRRANVDVDARYGTWDATNGRLVAPTPPTTG